MPTFSKIGFFINVILLLLNALIATSSLSSRSYAQRPPEFNQDGVPFLKVNINPTDIPPAVNINPDRSVPRVEVANLSELQVRLAPSGCQDSRNFETRISNSVAGPLVVTYLNLTPQTTVTFADGLNPAQSLNFAATGPLSTSIYLQSGQRLEFNSSVMYSGCKP